MKTRSWIVAFALSLLVVLSSAQLFQVLSVSRLSLQSVVSLTQRSHHQTDQQHRSTSPIAPSTKQSAKQFTKQSAKQPVKQAPTSTAAENQQIQQFEQEVGSLQASPGLFTLYRDRASNKLLAEIGADQLNVYYLMSMTLESGIGERGIYGGLPLADFVFNFRRVNNTLQFIAPNVYFRVQAEDPQRRAVGRSFSDSALAALPIKSYHPRRKTYLVDLTPLLLEDIPELKPLLKAILESSYDIDSSKSYLGLVKAFPANVELEMVYSFAADPSPDAPPPFVITLPNSRLFNLRVRYSLSHLPNTGYQPRSADDRVGYFISAFQNLSEEPPDTPFVRYINRWQLEKADPTLPLSPPKQPIVFWLENTIPLEYRDAVREGALFWNRAFEKIGFKDAIQVRQMPDKTSWDPADIRYNTIRWVTSFDGEVLGIGPFRANPLTGQILDADILLDSSFVRYLKQQYRSFDRGQQRQTLPLAKLSRNLSGCVYGYARAARRDRAAPKKPRLQLNPKIMGNYDLCYGLEASRQFAFGALARSMLQSGSPNTDATKEYVQEFLRQLVAHEVGHTLGLRHNFRGSAMLSPAQLNDPTITHVKGLVASVMDYSAVNLAPVGTPQGDYFPHLIGPYDEWAIAYGYTPSSPTQPEAQLLSAIARRAPEPDLAYGTDEDAYADVDPKINAFDLSSDLLTYAPQQLEIARQMWQRLEQGSVNLSGSYAKVRSMFDDIFEYYIQYSLLLNRYVGGQFFNRYQIGDAIGRLPFETVPLEQQRQALRLVTKYVFDSDTFRFSPNFLNQLAPSRWEHWGTDPQVLPLDYPIHTRIQLFQGLILSDLLNYERLSRLHDAELKAAPGQALTLPELFDTLQTAIWQVPLQSTKIQFSSLQRGLQREYIDQLSQIVMKTALAPEDARVLAWYNLKQLKLTLDDVLKRRDRELNLVTKAHLDETRDRIAKTLDAQLLTPQLPERFNGTP